MKIRNSINNNIEDNNRDINVKEIELNLTHFKNSCRFIFSDKSATGTYNHGYNKLSLFLSKLNETVNDWKQHNKQISDIINNDIKYHEDLPRFKKIKEYSNSLTIDNQISFCLGLETHRNHNTIYNYNNKKVLSRDGMKRITNKIKNLHQKRIRSNDRYVKEKDYSFSDDSFDHNLIVYEDNVTDEMLDILKKTTSATDINQQIRKSRAQMKNKLKLEKDLKCLVLMVDFLEIV